MKWNIKSCAALIWEEHLIILVTHAKFMCIAAWRFYLCWCFLAATVLFLGEQFYLFYRFLLIICFLAFGSFFSIYTHTCPNNVVDEITDRWRVVFRLMVHTYIVYQYEVFLSRFLICVYINMSNLIIFRNYIYSADWNTFRQVKRFVFYTNNN